jgi:dihydrofolate reductase
VARLSLIAAVARNGVIGRANQIPWRLPSDLKRFKTLTIGHPIIMGRKTFQSIGRPLPGRDNIVVSRHSFHADGVTVLPDLRSAIAGAASRAGENGEVFVIGGAEIYRETIGLADRLYVTEVDATPEGDAQFPYIDRRTWSLASTEDVARDANDSAATRFLVYERRK